MFVRGSALCSRVSCGQGDRIDEGGLLYNFYERGILLKVVLVLVVPASLAYVALHNR
jgi:hypothetical protein